MSLSVCLLVSEAVLNILGLEFSLKRPGVVSVGPWWRIFNCLSVKISFDRTLLSDDCSFFEA